MSERQLVPAEEYCTSVRDGTHDSPKEVKSGKPLATSKNILNGRVRLENTYRISEADFEEINRRSKVDQWDVLISMIGTVGEIGLVHQKPDFAIKNVGLFKCGEELRGKWLLYALSTRSAKERIYALSRGTTQGYVPLNALRKLPIEISTSESEMKAVVAILGTLDDKIELLRQMNETLEAIARALFESWFVDFDPVRKKADGLPTGLPKGIEDLFPSEFEDSELGEIPKGWRWKTVSEVCQINRGASPRPIQDFMGGAFPWIKIADATGSSGPFILKTKEHVKTEGIAKSVVVQVGDLILSNSASCGMPFFVGITGCIHDGWLYFQKLRHVSKEFLYCFFTSETENLVGLADGSVQKNLNTALVGSQRFASSGEEIMREFDSVVRPIFSYINHNTVESENLGDFRDSLLPKLISGELELTDDMIPKILEPAK